MERESEARLVCRAYDRAIRGRKGYGAGRLAIATGRGLRTVHNLCEGKTCPSVADLRVELRAFAAEGSGRDLVLLEDLLSDLGYEVRRAPRHDPATSPVVLALSVPAAAGEVAAELAEAMQDGRVDGSEAPTILPSVRRARHILDDLEAELRAIPSPQVALGGTL